MNQALTAFLAAALAVCTSSVLAEDQSAAPAPTAEVPRVIADSEVTSEANGSIELSTTQDSPVFAVFDRSPELTSRLREALKERGFVLAESADAAATVVTFKGDVALMGGKTFYKGVKVPIGDATEKAIAAEKASSVPTRAEVVGTTASLALNSAAYSATGNALLRGLNLSSMASTLGDATGLKAWFNTKVAGDPRGICLSRCEDWNKVQQTVYLFVTVQSKAGAKQEVRALTKAKSETVAPEQVLARSVDRAVSKINFNGERSATLTSQVTR